MKKGKGSFIKGCKERGEWGGAVFYGAGGAAWV